MTSQRKTFWEPKCITHMILIRFLGAICIERDDHKDEDDDYYDAQKLIEWS